MLNISLENDGYFDIDTSVCINCELRHGKCFCVVTDLMLGYDEF